MRRRHFLSISTTALGGTLIYTLDRQPLRAQNRRTKSLRIPLRFFTEDQALVVAAAAARIFPSDESGPGAAEAGVILYIDRQVAGPYGRDRYRYTQAPFLAGVPEQGYQEEDTPRAIYRKGLPQIAGLHLIPPEEQDGALRAIEHTTFFQLLRQHTIEGMFCDPMHGGNVDLIGWQLIGFPGPRMSYAREIDQYYGQAFRPRPASLRQIVGHEVRPSEDEE